jgi:hypothetical protein
MLSHTSQQQNGQPSQYVDPRYATGNDQFNPGLVAQQAQDPNNPAHPNHPKVSQNGAADLELADST